MSDIQRTARGFPYFNPSVFRTPNGVSYLKEPGVTLVSRPEVDLSGMQGFLDGFDEELGFRDYLNDPDELAPAEELIKAAGQLCYCSFSTGRTWNRDAEKYFDNIKSSGHGSVLEHANFTVLIWGISRSVTHELVRHRSGCAYSQVSQRYVDGKVLRFVERPEYQEDPELHADFEKSIEAAAASYERRAQRLIALQGQGGGILAGERKRDLRKKVNQAARSVLPNETEAPIFVTANARAWRHISEMRASGPAETEIRRMQMRVFQCLNAAMPLILSDYKVVSLPDGTSAVDTTYRKV